MGEQGSVLKSCLGCGSGELDPVLNLGDQPLANALTDVPAPPGEPRFPLELVACVKCYLVQLTLSVPPTQLFEDYVYFSSYTTTVVDNARSIVRRLVSERALGPEDLAMEVGSNDGYLLRHYLEGGVPVLGVDPAANIAEQARKVGVPTEVAFFGRDVAEELVERGYRASIVHANNVLAHVPDVNGVMAGIAHVLRVDGMAVIETPYLRDLVERREFDTIYHEHLYYYSVSSMSRLLERNGMRLEDVEHLPIHGGTLRLFAVRDDGGSPGAEPRRYMEEEEAVGLTSSEYLADFASEVDALRDDLRALLAELRGSGATIAGYGAAAKATVLLNAIGIGSETIDFVVDRNPHKQGKYLPGVGIPILDPAVLQSDQPDYLLVFVWNHLEEVLAQQQDYRDRGGRVIVPIPEPRVIEPGDVA